MPDVFLSYSREDQSTVRRYAEALKREGFQVWWDAALNPGETFDQVTEQALKEAKAVVVLWSKHSVTSRWVRSEATQADRYGTLVPVTIEPCDRPILFELTHTTDLSGWHGDRNDAVWRDFVASIRRLVEKRAARANVTAAPIATAAPAAARGSRATVFGGAIAAAVVIGGGLLWYFQGRSQNAPATRTAGGAAIAPVTLASVAVLPFRDMSQGKDQEYFADGVTEEILNKLAGLKDLKVTARTSAFAFKGKDIDLRTVGETLGVQHILEGSIRKDGDQLRITAQLIDATSDAHVWSQTYDRPLQDIFNVQEEIARSVADALQVALGVGFGRQPGMTRDMAAYDAYLAAGPLVLRYTADDQRRAAGLLEEAVRRDPAFVNAWMRLASVYDGMTLLVGGDRGVWQQKADAALENVRRLAPNDPDLHARLAWSAMSRYHWSEAEGHLRDLDAALEGRERPAEELLDRNIQLLTGRAREARDILEQQKARDPLNPNVSYNLAISHSLLRDFTAAAAEFDRGDALDESFRYQIRSGAMYNAMATGNRPEIERRIDALIPVLPPEPRRNTILLRAKLDRPADALAQLRARALDPTARPAQVRAQGRSLAYFGDPTAALEALRRAYREGDAPTPDYWLPVMREARRLPEFKQLMLEQGYVDYWRKYGWGDFCKPVSDTDFECT